MPRFSVIIPVHNRSALVRQTIDSVLTQTFTDHEIIVVNDASTDDTVAVLQAYGGAIRTVSLAEQSGCEVARNAGAAAATGSYLAFLDSDDLFYPWALETYDFVLARTGQPAMLVSRFVSFSHEPSPPAPTPGSEVEIIVFQDYLSRDRTVPSTASMIVVRRDVFVSAGGWRQSTVSTFYGSDHDFLLRIGCHEPAVLLERPRVLAYRVHPGNAVRDLRAVVGGIMRLIAAERHGSYPGGRERRLDRRAVIGNQTYWWSRRALLEGQPGLALRLLLDGFDMILARVVKRLRTNIRGLTPVTKMYRDPPAQPAPPAR
jgi:glycosyltransferase involved in cell wall biosynthesis